MIISQKYAEYVIACRVMGLSMWYIIFREMLPNTVSLLTIQFIGLFQGAIAASMGLMLLGALAFRPSNWGVMLNMALANTGVAYNNAGLLYFFTPIVCLALLQLGCLFFTQGLDKAFDPRLRTE
jgi:peptide/nickel transport system permease protein